MSMAMCGARAMPAGRSDIAVTVWTPDGKLIGRIRLPEVCGNLCFGGPKRNRLFMAASQSLYAVYVNTQARRQDRNDAAFLAGRDPSYALVSSETTPNRRSRSRITLPRRATRPITIWLRSPASQWDHAFPLGNGRLGAMVFGAVNRERIQLNDETLWMGGPRETDNPEAPRLARSPASAVCRSASRSLRAGRAQADGKAVAARVVSIPR